jgi:hypothetical protein
MLQQRTVSSPYPVVSRRSAFRTVSQLSALDSTLHTGINILSESSVFQLQNGAIVSESQTTELEPSTPPISSQFPSLEPSVQHRSVSVRQILPLSSGDEAYVLNPLRSSSSSVTVILPSRSNTDCSIPSLLSQSSSTITISSLTSPPISQELSHMPL